MALAILDKSLAEQFYKDILNLIEQPNREYYDKILDLGGILEEVYTDITKNALSESADLYDKIKYIRGNYSTVPQSIIDEAHLIRKTCNQKRHKRINPPVSYYTMFIESLMNCIFFYSSIIIPAELKNTFEKMLPKAEPEDKIIKTEQAKENRIKFWKKRKGEKLGFVIAVIGAILALLTTELGIGSFIFSFFCTVGMFFIIANKIYLFMTKD